MKPFNLSVAADLPEAGRPAAFCSLLRFLLFCLLFLPCSAYAAEGIAAVTVLNPSGVRSDGTYVDTLLKDTMRLTGVTNPPLTDVFPKTSEQTGDGGAEPVFWALRSVQERVSIRRDALVEINSLFHRRGWTDGLPIIPPTPERVTTMLRGTDLSPDFTVATVEPMRGEATVEKIAINAVMAGCKPEYLPLLIAAVEAVTEGGTDLLGSSTSTSADAPIIIASGPMIKELGINDGRNTFGRGNQANSSIGRAFHLILHNVGGSRPGLSDVSSTGQPGEFVGFLAESPRTEKWGPLHATLGLPAHINAVTVVTAEGFHGIRGGEQQPEGFLNLVADGLRSDSWPHRATVLVVIADDTGNQLEQAGWTRKSMEAYLRDKAQVSLAEFRRVFGDARAGVGLSVPRRVAEETDENLMVPRPFIDNLLFVRAGGPGLKNMLIPCWHYGKPYSKEVRFPHNLAELLKETADAPYP